MRLLTLTMRDFSRREREKPRGSPFLYLRWHCRLVYRAPLGLVEYHVIHVWAISGTKGSHATVHAVCAGEPFPSRRRHACRGGRADKRHVRLSYPQDENEHTL